LNAFVAGFQVRLELFEAGSRAFELGVRNPYLTDSLSGAASVGGQQNVAVTADVSEVDFNTTPNLESPVQRFSHDDHFALGTLGTKHFRIAVVTSVHT